MSCWKNDIGRVLMTNWPHYFTANSLNSVQLMFFFSSSDYWTSEQHVQCSWLPLTPHPQIEFQNAKTKMIIFHLIYLHRIRFECASINVLYKLPKGEIIFIRSTVVFDFAINWLFFEIWCSGEASIFNIPVYMRWVFGAHNLNIDRDSILFPFCHSNQMQRDPKHKQTTHQKKENK